MGKAVDGNGVAIPMELVAVSAQGELDRWMEKYKDLNAFVVWGLLSSVMVDARKRLDLETQLAASAYAMAQAQAQTAGSTPAERTEEDAD